MNTHHFFTGTILAMLHEGRRQHIDFGQTFHDRQGGHGLCQMALLRKGFDESMQETVFQNVHERLGDALGRILQ